MERIERPKFQSPEFRQVTERTYEQYLEYFALPEELLKGKRIIDIGSGFSNFVEIVNKRFGRSGTRAIGVDPVYAFFKDDFEKFKKSLEGTKLFLDFVYGARPGRWAESQEEWQQARKKFYTDFLQEIKSSEAHIAGRHQELSFKDESVDLIMANNSLTLFKDREIIRQSLAELLRVLKNDGEIRLHPLNLRWRDREKSVCLSGYGEMTDEEIAEAEKTGKYPDKKFFNILKELEESGIKLYSFSVKLPVADLEGKTEIEFGNIILRKDDKIPEVDEKIENFHELRKLNFAKSSDDFYIPSKIIRQKSKVG